MVLVCAEIVQVCVLGGEAVMARMMWWMCTHTVWHWWSVTRRCQGSIGVAVWWGLMETNGEEKLFYRCIYDR